MNFVLFLLVTAVLVFGIYAETHKVRGRIFNGHDAENGQFKFLAFLIMEEVRCCRLLQDFHICGGAIIAENWVLTAAHCLDGMIRASVYLGASAEGDSSIAYTVSESYFVPHPEYTENGNYNDIALIRIPKTLECDELVYARLPSFSTSEMFVDKIAVIMGWGVKGNAGQFSEKLQTAKVAVMSNVECNAFYPHTTAMDLCVKTKKPFGSTCKGDSGGPLVLEETEELIGVSSFLPSDTCEDENPAIFMRVTSYLPWIMEVIGDQSV